MATLTTTCQNIIDATAQDIRQQLSSSASPGQAILVDYCNRVNLNLARVSRWEWLLSPVKRFVTQAEVTDYWIGATGTGTLDTFDTGLNLTNVERLKDNSVFDRSNFRQLLRVEEMPLSSKLSYSDESPRPGRPLEWRNSPDTPNVINLYPAPDNQNTYQPVPESPICSTSVAGALASRVYYVRTAFVDSLGNISAASDNPTKVWVPANSVLVVNPPIEPITKGATGIKYDRFNVYASTTQGSETLQSSNNAVSAAWTEPTTGLVAGTAFPTTNAVEPVDGYVIEFRYYNTRTPITAASQVIQVPDHYKDIVVSGVNYLAFQYLNRPREAAEWKQNFQSGVIQIIHDKNLFPAGNQFVHPDPASVGGGFAPSIETLDQSSFF